MSDREALIQFMQDGDFDAKTLAAATRDTYSAIYMMIRGDRPVNDAFKWRFARAFGWEEAERVFGVVRTPVEA